MGRGRKVLDGRGHIKVGGADGVTKAHKGGGREGENGGRVCSALHKTNKTNKPHTKKKGSCLPSPPHKSKNV